jgi:tetratricopeptide (TPR) repeat protein
MQARFSMLATLLLLSAIAVPAAVDVSDLGAPAGMSATQYEELGVKAFQKHDYARARNFFTAAVRVEPDRWIAYYDRAVTYAVQKNWPSAIEDLNRTIRLKPAFFEASWVRAGVYWRMGNYKACFRDLDVLEPLAVTVQNADELVRILNLRAWIRATSRDASARNARLAVRDAKRACNLTKWSEAWLIDTLAAACAEAGDFESAVQYQEQAFGLSQSRLEKRSRRFDKSATDKQRQDAATESAKTLQDYKSRVLLYKEHRPYRGTPGDAFGDWPSMPLGL